VFAGPPPPPPVVKRIVLRGVHFDYKRADVRPDWMPVLREVAEILKSDAKIAIIVEGHTDSTGSESYNYRLSLRRATAVRDYLAKLGVAPERMSAHGRGEYEPVADNATREGRAQNRRVELLMRYQ
jgi:OOP family OmpA-OmpF porin